MAGVIIDGTSALKAASSPIVKRAEEEVVGEAGKKVLGKAAGKVAGKAAGVGGLLLNSAPVAGDENAKAPWQKKDYDLNKALEWEKIKSDPIQAIKDKRAKIDNTLANADLKTAPKAETKAETKLDYNLNKESKPETKDKEPKNQEESKLRNYQPEMEEKKETPSADNEGSKKVAPKVVEKAKSKPDYHNIISYYKTGGYGDPQSADAKRNMGFAILGQIGKTAGEISNIAMANAGKAGNANTVSQWDAEQAQAQQQHFDFEDKDKTLEQTVKIMEAELANNKEMQAEMQKLQKDLVNWSDEHAATYYSGKKFENMSPKERQKAAKDYFAAKGNSIAAGSIGDWTAKFGGAAVSVALPMILGAMRK